MVHSADAYPSIHSMKRMGGGGVSYATPPVWDISPTPHYPTVFSLVSLMCPISMVTKARKIIRILTKRK